MERRAASPRSSMCSYACKISVGANGSQDTQQIVGAANTDGCWLGITSAELHSAQLSSDRMGDGLPISLAEVAAPVQSCSYESIPTCTCNMHMRVPPRAMDGNGCERDQRIGLGGSDDTCIRYGVWPLVTNPPSAARYATPLILRQGAKLSPGRCGTSRADVVT